MRMVVKEYMWLCGARAGYCSSCDNIGRDFGTEPDAREYECWTCGEKTCEGIEMALASGGIEIVKSQEESDMDAEEGMDYVW